MDEVWGHSGDKLRGGKSEGGVSSVEWARKWSLIYRELGGEV